MCTYICTYMDKLDFQACSPATTEKASCYIFKAGPLITCFFPWSLVKSQKSNFKTLGLGFQSLAGKKISIALHSLQHIKSQTVWSMYLKP